MPGLGGDPAALRPIPTSVGSLAPRSRSTLSVPQGSGSAHGLILAGAPDPDCPHLAQPLDLSLLQLSWASPILASPLFAPQYPQSGESSCFPGSKLEPLKCLTRSKSFPLTDDPSQQPEWGAGSKEATNACPGINFMGI